MHHAAAAGRDDADGGKRKLVCTWFYVGGRVPAT